jgi:diguanylate cyclase (GGDEF)-like protein
VWIASCCCAEESIVVLFVDVDDFKAVNDGHGHAVGDEVLRVFARRLRDSVRDTDLVARLGGDEFAVTRRCRSSDQPRWTGERIEEAMAGPTSSRVNLTRHPDYQVRTRPVSTCTKLDLG